MGMLCSACVWAQTDTGTADNAPPTQSGPKPAFTYPDTTPSLDFLSEGIENSSLTLGISTGFAFDSYGYASTSNSSQGRWLFNVAPMIRIQQFLPKLAWHLAYSGGLQVYQQVSGPSNNSSNSKLFSQNASAGFIWQMSRHWQLMANDTYTYSANPFDSFLTIPGTPSENNPNPVNYVPLTRFEVNSAIVTLTNQITKRDTLAFSGTSNLRRTSTYNILTSVPFYNMVSYSGRANYSHQLTPRLSLGAGYDFNSLDFGHGQQRSGIQTISFTTDYLIRPNMTISGWIGPEYTSTKTIVFDPFVGRYVTSYNQMWSTAAGVNFGWQGHRNSVRAGYSRQVSDGGGITATTQVNSVSASYRRSLNAKLNLLLGLNYLHNVSVIANQRSFSNLYGSVGLAYQISKSFSATANYVRIHQSQSSAFVLGSQGYDDNRVGASINYSWNHPLGR
jgi:hypothetical protein